MNIKSRGRVELYRKGEFSVNTIFIIVKNKHWADIVCVCVCVWYELVCDSCTLAYAYIVYSWAHASPTSCTFNIISFRTNLYIAQPNACVLKCVHSQTSMIQILFLNATWLTMPTSQPGLYLYILWLHIFIYIYIDSRLNTTYVAYCIFRFNHVTYLCLVIFSPTLVPICIFYVQTLVSIDQQPTVNECQNLEYHRMAEEYEVCTKYDS